MKNSALVIWTDLPIVFSNSVRSAVPNKVIYKTHINLTHVGNGTVGAAENRT